MVNSFDISDLNDKQRCAVQFPLEPLLVIAGPGTGKTRTLVYRVIYLIEHYRLSPERILAVTYTNKATEEMRERLQKSLGDRAREMTVGTFHGFCIRILRSHHEAAGLPKHFTVAGEDMQIEVLGRVMKNLAPENRIQSLKTMLGKLSHYRLNPGPATKPLSNFEKQILANYQAELKKNCLIDFDDILLLTHELLTKDSDILAECCSRFAAILIDEFQDTDKVQYEIIKLLALGHRNIFAVADDDQSIFAWRGAHPLNVYGFQGDFAGDNVIHLDSNYRSTKEIVDQADRLICNNPRLAVKTKAEVFRSGPAVRFETFENETDEAAFVIREIQETIIANPELTHSHFAALFSRHSIGENLEQEFMKARIPCQLVRGKSILEHEEIEKALLLLRLIYNAADQVTLEKFVQRELGDLVFTQLKEMQSQREGMDFKSALVAFSKLESVSEQDRSKAYRIIRNTKNLIDFTQLSPDRRLSSLMSEIIACISEWRLSPLQSIASEISDPFGLSGMIDAACTLRDAVRNKVPIVVAGSNVVVGYIVGEMLTRVFPNARIANSEVANESDDLAKARLFLVLDTVAYEEVKSADDQIIYVGIALPDGLRDTTSDSSRIFKINPYEIPKGERGLEPSIIAAVFKLFQAAACLDQSPFLTDYTAIDIETTDIDTKTNEIIELAAVRVRNGQPVAEYNQLIKPLGPISSDAQRIHGITIEMLSDCRSFIDLVSGFLEFIGDDVLVAHNGDEFDFKCIRNRLRDCGRIEQINRTFDTLPFARRLYPGKGAGIDALAAEFKIETGQRHRALDDTRCLIQIFERLKREHDARQRATSHEACLDLVSLGILVEHGNLYDRNALLLKYGALMLEPNSATMAQLREPFPDMRTDDLESEIDRLRQEHQTVGLVSQQAFALLSRFDEIVSRFDDLPLEKAIEDFLDFASMYHKQDGLEHRNAVTLMTIHAAKGLEFRNVFVVGLEQRQIPSYYSLKSGNPDDINEQRRLLYVAMTRAKEQLILTGATNRDSRLQQHSQFLRELDLEFDFDGPAVSESSSESPG